MITENTIILNVTAELSEYFRSHLRFHPFAVSPSRMGERGEGYNMGVGIGLRGMILQFKKGIPERNGYRYHLNDTAQQDQQLRLLHLERMGYPVYYALPQFHLLSHVVRGDARLRNGVAWFRPTQVISPNGPVGRYDIVYNHHNNSWKIVGRQEKFIESPMSFSSMLEDFIGRRQQNVLELVLGKLNDILVNGISEQESKYVIDENMHLKTAGPAKHDFLRGQMVFGYFADDFSETEKLADKAAPAQHIKH